MPSTTNATVIEVTGNVTLSGVGTLSMANNVNNDIEGVPASSAWTLTNGPNHTIEGSGQLGEASLNLVNNGTILANQSVALTIFPGNGNSAINNGTFQANSGSTLVVNGSFTTAGTVNIGQVGGTAASLFQMLGQNDYVQTGGTTSLLTSSSTLSVASSHSVDLMGGTLEGIGTISGNLSNTGGTILPGTPGEAGILTITGKYSDPQGSLDIQIGGLTAGTGFSQLAVQGDASLGGTLEVSLINGFTPAVGETFEFLTSAGLNGTMFADNVIQVGNFTFTATYINNDTDVLLTVGAARYRSPPRWSCSPSASPARAPTLLAVAAKPPNRENSAEKGTF